MLREILSIIYESRVYSKSHISKELNISEDMAESGINQLLNMGFIREDETSPYCVNVCSGCPMKNCNKDIVKTFTVTDKGLRTINS